LNGHYEIFLFFPSSKHGPGASATDWAHSINKEFQRQSKNRKGDRIMNGTIAAMTLAMLLAPAVVFSHEVGSRLDYLRWRHDAGPVARRGDPGYYCHKHQRKIHPDDKRRHCHSAYNDPHGIARERDFRRSWWRRY
jgi:hypothetical protein